MLTKNRFSKKLRTLLAVILIGLFTSGCTIKLAYNFLDWGLYWELEDYVKFNRDQRKIVKQDIDDLIDWHRNDELPIYADQLSHLVEGLETKLTLDHLHATFDGLNDGWQRLVIQTLPSATDILSKLSDEQVNDFFEILLEEEEDDASDIIRDSAEKLLEERIEYVTEKFNDIIGRLNDEQKDLVNNWASAIEATDELSLEHAIQWRILMQAAMENRQDKVQLSKALDILFAHPDTLWSDEYRRRIEKNQTLITQLLFDANLTLTDKQRKKTIRQLKGFIEDLRELSD